MHAPVWVAAGVAVGAAGVAVGAAGVAVGAAGVAVGTAAVGVGVTVPESGTADDSTVFIVAPSSWSNCSGSLNTNEP